ncbi:hypothetical protein [Xanthovirga aplysinae]|uniref:hypothetical protein n=1 Tax=Xanthovirga aplysinae TaxID=2529853 RepID=UPI0012BC2456|nr:hypothetical protein [Xanthovirga aplysinae]MTI31352.1 hypothetical protein [Xanthovirga aplysinae]
MKKIILPLIALFVLSTSLMAAPSSDGEDAGLSDGGGGRSAGLNTTEVLSTSNLDNGNENTPSNIEESKTLGNAENLSWWEILLDYLFD